MKGYCWKKKVKHTKKLKLLLTICLVFSTLAPILPRLTFEETKAATEESTLKTIRSNIVENQLPSSTNSTETIKEKESEGSEITSLVPDNVEPEKKDDSTDDMTHAAESKITIADTGIILKNDGTYILYDSPELYADYPSLYPAPSDIKGEGEYDSNTILEFANVEETTEENRIYSEPGNVNNKIQQITTVPGTTNKVKISRNSALDIETGLEYGIFVDRLIIGESTEIERQAVMLNVIGSKIGIYTPKGTHNVTGNVTTRGSQSGISISEKLPPDREDFTALNDYANNLDPDYNFPVGTGSYVADVGTNMITEATGEGSAGAIFKNVQMNGSNLTASGDRYGYFDGGATDLFFAIDRMGLEPTNTFYEGQILGSSNEGIAFFTKELLTLNGGNVTGETITGTGVEGSAVQMSQSNEPDIEGNYHFSEISGTTTSGFGVLMRTVDMWDENIIMSMGSINTDGGKVFGSSSDGTGVMSSVTASLSGFANFEIVGLAEKGQGIISRNLGASVSMYGNTDPINATVRGESNGASKTTVEVVKQLLSGLGEDILATVPSCAGIIASNGVNISSEYSDGIDTEFTATAPIGLKDSYGLWSPDTGGEVSGLSIQGINKAVVRATGDTGIKIGGAVYIGRMSYASETVTPAYLVDVDSKIIGIDASRIKLNGEGSFDDSGTMPTVDIVTSEGDGIRASSGINIISLLINISATNNGIYAPDPNPTGEGYGYTEGIQFSNGIVNIKDARYGIKTEEQRQYYLRNVQFNVTTSVEGIAFEDTSDGYGDFDSIVMNIDSGNYGLKMNGVDTIYFRQYGDYGTTGKEYPVINAIADQYPIWIEGAVQLNFAKGSNPENGEPLDDHFIITATSRNLVPDKAEYPALYVKDHNMNIENGGDGLQIIENYQTPASKPFNATPSTPYATEAAFNIEKYGNYQWSATRTDNDASIAIDESNIDQNQLSTNDNSYIEAKLTANRVENLVDERIFNSPDGVQMDSEILHQINMLVRREEQYRVTYDSNGADGGDVPIDSNLYSENDPVNVAPQGNLTLTDHTFIGWLNSVDGQIYQNPQIPNSPTSYTMGQSDVTFTAQWRSNSVVEELTLIDGKIPSNLNFGTHDIQYDTDKIFYATDDGTNTENGSATNLTTGEVGILDTRLNTEGWSLTVKQLDQFKTSTNQELSSAELGFKVGSLDTSQSTGGIPSGVDNEEIILIPGNARELLRASNGQGKGTVTLPIERFTLKVPKESSKQAGQSTTEVEWTLSNVPAP